MHRIAIVGGGTGGTVLANRLASELQTEIEAGMDEATFIEFTYGEEPYVREPSKPLHWAKLGYNESYWPTARGLL